MGGDDVITQSKFGRKTTFQFGDDKLAFTLSDQTGRAEWAVFYDAIDPENSSTVTVNAGQRYFPPVLILAVLAMIAAGSFGAPPMILGSLPLVIFIAIWALRYSKIISVGFTILPVAGRGAVNRVRIIRDKNHDRILQRIKTARIARIRRLHLAVNPAAHPADEAKKFRWLWDHGIIDEAEYRAAMGQLAPEADRREAGWEAPDGTRMLN